MYDLFFATDDVTKLTVKQPLQEVTKPRWDANTNTLYGFDGQPHKIKGPAQIHILKVLFDRCGKPVNKQELVRGWVSKEDVTPDKRIKRINAIEPELIQNNGEKEYYIPSLCDSR